MHSKVHQLGQLEHACISNTGQIHHAKGNGYQISGQHTDQNGGKLPDSFSKMIQRSYNSQGEECNQPVLPGTVVRIGSSACHIVDGSWIQGKSNGENYCSCDQRREKYANLLHQNSHDNRYNSTCDLRSHNGINSVSVRNGLHTWHICEADTHDHGKSGTNPKLFPDWKQLDQSGKRSDHKSSLNEDDLVLILKAGCSCHNNGRGDTSHDHCNYMLQRKRKSFLDTRDTISFKNTASLHNVLLLSFVLYSIPNSGRKNN